MGDYTKGKWKAYKTDFKPDRWAICAGKNGEWGIAKTLLDGKIPPAAKKANAHLIAAAPDMYEALKQTQFVIRQFNELLSRRTDDDGIVGALDALFDNVIWDEALAKAEGKS